MSEPGRAASADAELSAEDRELLARLIERETAPARPAPIRPRADASSHPLSFAQERMWFLHAIDPGSGVYNIPFAARLRGVLDEDALRRALETIVLRHEVLRTRFEAGSERPAAVVDPSVSFLSREDLGGLLAADREAALARLLAAEVRAPFDLQRGPLLRALLVRLGEQEHALVLTLHHIVSDAWSIGVLLQELVALYSAFLTGRGSPLPDLPVQYADFADWQRRFLQGPTLETQLDYWRAQLGGALPVLELPTDRPRPAVQTSRGAFVAHTLEPALLADLKRLAQREGATLFMVLLAGFQALLSRYSRQTDIVVGSPIANRTRREVEGLIGFFVNTLALRTDLSGDPTFRELISRVREVALGAYAHQDVPFEKLVEVLRPERAPSHSPLFQVVFNLQNAPAGSLRLPGLTLTALDAVTETAKFDLALHLTAGRFGLQTNCEYNADLFDAATIERMLGHYRRLLEATSAAPEAPLSSFTLLDDKEREQLVVEWNSTSRPYPATSVSEAFEDQARRTPNAVAVVCGAERLTYAELDARSNQLARFLRRHGVGLETRVGICAERSLELVVGLLAILKAGGAYVPLDPDYPQDRLSFMIRDAGLSVLLTQERLLDRLGEAGLKAVCLDRLNGSESSASLDLTLDSEQLAYVTYTSGSTGIPKGVEVKQRGVLRLVLGADYAELGPDEVFLQLAPVSFDASTLELWGPLLNGGRCVLFPSRVPTSSELGEVLRREGVTTLWLTSSLYNSVIDEAPEALFGLKQLLIGGEALSVAHVKRGYERLERTQIINGYGPTEGTTFTCCHPIPREVGEVRSIPIGRPIANTRVYVLDGSMEVVPVGLWGELFIGGDGVARGYLGRPELTAERFVPDPFGEPGQRLYRTGDVVRYLRDGTIEFLGRADEQVKVRGYRIELGEIEAAIAEWEGVQRCAVIVREDVPGDKRLVAYVVWEEGADRATGELRDHLRSKLPEYMVPGAFVVLRELPLSPNGKVDRRALRAPDGSGTGAGQEAPRSPLEEILAGIYGDVLGVERVGIHDSFFDLGGHSLLGTRVVSRTRQALGTEVPLRWLFEAPTVAGLARRLEQSKDGHRPAAPPRRRSDGSTGLPVSFAQQRLWLLEQLEPGTGLYNIGAALRLEGRLDVRALERSLGTILERHEALRARFRRSGAGVVQDIEPAGGWRLPVFDLSHLPATEGEAEARRRSSEETRRPFDLSTGPLLRARLFRLGEDAHVLALAMHHVVSDGWSVGILVRELGRLYAAEAGGQPANLPDLPVQYADFAAWQREWLRGDALEAQLAYWRKQLSGAPQLLEIPTDHPRPAVPRRRGSSRQITLDAASSGRLVHLARREGATLFMVLLAAFKALLARYSGQSDIVVGSPIANRTREEVEGLIGFFVNTLALRTDVSGNPSFRELLRRVREVALEAYAHQDVPFEKLVEELNPERAVAHHPLFQVVCVLQNASRETLDLPGIRLSPQELDAEAPAKFDLLLTLVERPEGLRVSLGYDTDLFEAATIERMLGHYRRLLEAASAAPEAPLSSFTLLDDKEREQLVVEWNSTSRPYPATSVSEAFEDQARRTPNAVAVVCGAERLTYAELDARSNQLARFLRRHGVGLETRVGICAERSVELVVGLLAILKAGGAYVPLDPDYPQDRLGFMVRDAGLSVLLTQERLLDRLGEAGSKAVCLDRLDLGSESGARLGLTPDPEQLAYVTYTSGSTGIPKGVEVKQRGVLRLVLGADYAELGPDEVFLQLAPVSFDASTLELWGPLLNGGRCVLFPSRVPTSKELGEVLRRYGVTTLWLTSSLYNAVIDESPEALFGLKQLLIGGEALSVAHVRRGAERLKGTRIINGYGPTEGTTFTCCHPVPREVGEVRSIPIGRPIANTRVYVLDGSMEVVPVGLWGELFIGGDGVARGYLGRPALTAERFVPDPFGHEPGQRLYRTGDVVRYLGDGTIEFLGRVDEQVKVRGYRIELGEIEAAIAEVAGVQRCAVVVREDTPGDKRLVAYVVWEESADRATGELRDHLRRKLPGYMVPGTFVALDELPLSPNGKVDRRALPAPEGRAERLAAYVEPVGDVERAVAGVWREVLGVEKVGLEDNFFDLGGHSLLLVQAHERLGRVFPGRSLTVVDLFRHPTVASLAARLGGGDRPGSERLARGGREAAEATSDRRAGREVAIVGLSGRFPGAADVDAFWRNLRNGVESLLAFSDDELQAAGVPQTLLGAPNYVKVGAVLEAVELFDARFFGYTPREAEVMDPQHRVFLETARAALEAAGYDPEAAPGRVGVYAGASMSSYLLNNLYRNPQFLASVGGLQAKIGNDKDALATRVSYKLNLQGPSFTVQTACSTALVAVHVACQGLLTGECDLALAGGVSVNLPQKTGYLYAEDMILSPDGHCRAFDARAQGTVAGSGVGVVALKRLADALRDGDTIHAVIKGSAVNNDGALKVGYTAPGVDGQSKVIRAALEASGIAAADVTYVEAHGTGTSLGDPIEVEALTQAFREGTDKKGYCALGSVKTNVGHLDAAAGVAGLIKAALAVEHGEIPPSLHFEEPNPKIDFANSPFFVNTELRRWEGVPVRRAGVSSFGIGGTNAHVVLEEAPAREASEEARPWQLLVLSAKTEGSVERAAERLREHLGEHPELNLADVSYTLGVGRHAFKERRVALVRDAAEASRLESGKWERGSVEGAGGKVVFLFTGQGSQYPNMGRGLYESERVFREAMDACAETLRGPLGLDLREVMYPRPGEEERSGERLKETSLTQPALFALEYALSRLWMSWGIEPAGMIGHSIGEYVAAHLGGVFTLEEALGLVSERGRLMQGMPRGSMVAVPLGEEELAPLLGVDLSLAAVNGPGQCVASGDTRAVADLTARLKERGVEVRALETSHAFHSSMMDGMLEAYRERVSRVVLKAPSKRFVSNVTGEWITAEQAKDPGYWVSQLRRCVRFGEGLAKLVKETEASVLLELGPGAALSHLAQAVLGRETPVASSLRGTKEEDRASVLRALGRLWLGGVEVDWAGVHEGGRRRRVPLPTYAFDRQRYWVEPSTERPGAAVASNKKTDLADWFYLPSWKRTRPPAAFAPTSTAGTSARWLILGDGCGLAAKLSIRLRRAGQSVTTVTEGPTLDYVALLAALRADGGLPGRILHLWGVTPPDEPRGLAHLDRSQERGFYSVLALTRALGLEAEDDTRLLVVTSGMQEVSTEGLSHPEKATVLGPCLVATQEHAGLRCRALDVAVPAGGEWIPETVEGLLAELSTPDGDPLVAYRGVDRWVQSLEAVRLEGRAGTPPRLRESGCYLVTGGLGGIGLALAEYLAAEISARLVLVGRKGLPPREQWPSRLGGPVDGDDTARRIRKVQELEGLGAEVLVLGADVSDLGRMREVLAQAEARFGRVDGVIHAAGVAGGGVISLKTRESAEAVMAPKVKAMLVLEELTRDKRLDFVAVCSSLASLLGGFGQVDYCGANAFLDAWARRQTSQGGPFTVSIAWDTWREVGMAVDTAMPGDLEAMRQGRLQHGLGTREGVEAFRRILRERISQVVVAKGDLEARRRAAAAGASPAKAEGPKAAAAGGAKARHRRPALANACVPPRDDLERTVVAVWSEFLGFEDIGVHDSFFDLGGHSLLATQIVNRLRETFQVRLALQTLFEAGTVAGLAGELVRAETRPGQVREIARTVQAIEALSADETLRLLQEARPAGGAA